MRDMTDATPTASSVVGAIDIDDSALPLLRIKFHGSVDDDEFQRYLDAVKTQMMSGRRYALVLDALDAAVPTPPQRRLQAEFIAEHRAQMATACVAVAFVIGNSLVRGALTAILWFQPMPVQHAVFGNVAAAEDWCRALAR